MSIDRKMAWRNIWRNPRRSVLTIGAIVFACTLLVFMLSLQFGSYDTMIDFTVRIHTGYLQVQATDYHTDRDIRHVVPNPGKVGDILADIPEVSSFTYRANAFALVSSEERTYGALVIGIVPEREAEVSTLESMIRQGEYLAPDDPNGTLVGRMLADNLKVGIGDELVVLGQGRDGSVAATVLTIRGIFASGQEDFDRSSIHMPLATFQDVFSMRGAVHEVVIMGHSLDNLAAVKRDVYEQVKDLANHHSLVVLDWKELMPGLYQGIQMDLVSGFIFYLFLIVVVAFSILNTFLMAILERTREFGVMMAMGTTPGRLIRVLLMESMTMTVIGIGLGIICGILLTGYFQVHGITFPDAGEILQKFGIPDRIYPQLSGLSITIGPAAVLVITFFTALYPALKVRRLRPVEALGHV